MHFKLQDLKKFQLILSLLFVLLIPQCFGEYIPMVVKQASYTFSLVAKDIIVFLVPFLIFAFLFNSLISLGHRALIFIVMLLILVSLSNFTAIISAYFASSTVLSHLPFEMPTLIKSEDALAPLFSFSIPKLIKNEPAIIIGIILGVAFAVNPNTKVTSFAAKMNSLAYNFLKKAFMPILPLFILGFVFKLEHDQLLSLLFTQYTVIVLCVITFQACYILGFYYIANALNFRKTISSLRNMFPAMVTAFSTISSAATLPVTVACTEKNLPNPSFARMIVPATANIHTLGSAIGITTFSLAVLISFGYGLPSFSNFLVFAFYYTMAKYAVAGIPGGVLIVVTPLLETYLGFTSEMVGFIAAIYLLMDPFGTATNVSCNGAFAILFNRLYKGQEILENESELIKIR